MLFDKIKGDRIYHKHGIMQSHIEIHRDRIV